MNILFPGDKGWFKAWTQDPTTWMLLGLFLIAWIFS